MQLAPFAQKVAASPVQILEGPETIGIEAMAATVTVFPLDQLDNSPVCVAHRACALTEYVPVEDQECEAFVDEDQGE